MRRFGLKTFFAFALSIMQFCAPAISTITELPCDEKQAEVCHLAPCCQTEAPAQMACCNETRPTQKEAASPALVSSAKLYFDLASPIAFAEIGCALELPTNPHHADFVFDTRFVSNERYKLLATFLI